MSTLYGRNYDEVYNNNGKVDPGEYNGHKKVMFEDYTFAAEASSADIIKLGKLPKGARVLLCTLKSPDLGGTGTIDIGTTDNGTEPADQDGFIAAADASGQAVQQAGSGAYIGQKFSEETVVQAYMNGATGSATGKTIKVWLEYIVD